METKYIKVYVRLATDLPKQSGRYITNKGYSTLYTLDEGFVKTSSMGSRERIKVDWYFIEVPDHEAELVEMLIKAERELNPSTLSGSGEQLAKEFKCFIQKIKSDG